VAVVESERVPSTRISNALAAPVVYLIFVLLVPKVIPSSTDTADPNRTKLLTDKAAPNCTKENNDRVLPMREKPRRATD